jgi:hypothetical protein
VPARGAEAAAEVDDLQVQPRPALGRERAAQVALGLLDRAAGREIPALREPVDVRVDRERRDAERLAQDDARGLAADAGELDELLERARDLPAVLRDELLRQPTSAFAFAGARPTWRMSSRTSSTGSFAIAAGVRARANKAGVTSFTFLSVVCAERTTATSRVTGSTWSSGIGTSGTRSSRTCRMRASFSAFFIAAGA